MKKKWISIVVILIIIACLTRIIYINVTDERYHVTVEEYEMGEVYTENNFSYCVKASEILTPEEVEAKYNIEISEGVEMYDSRGKGILFAITEIELENKSDEGREYTLSDIYYEAGAFSNGLDSWISGKLNGEKVFRPYEKRSVYAVTFMGEILFGYKGWQEDAKDMKLKLVFRKLYPRQVVLKCY